MLSTEQKAQADAKKAKVIPTEQDEDDDDAGGDDSGNDSDEEVSEDELAALKEEAGVDEEEEVAPVETGRRSRRGGGKKLDYAGTYHLELQRHSVELIDVVFRPCIALAKEQGLDGDDDDE